MKEADAIHAAESLFGSDNNIPNATDVRNISSFYVQ
jgi:hypothetical protein